MKIERGVEAGGIRIRLTLQSEDGVSHSAMSDNVEVFNELADMLTDVGRSVLRRESPRSKSVEEPRAENHEQR